MGGTDPVLTWLLAGDPSIRWQVLAHLVDASPDEVAAERARVAGHGWGVRLLGHQDPDGTWGGGLYSPKWTSTTYTLLLLRDMGLDPDHPGARLGCHRLFDGEARYLGPPATVRSRPEACITGMFTGLAAYFGVDRPDAAHAVEWLIDTALPDGGWNCQTVRTGSRHSSFHTTIIVLEALAELHRRHPDPALAERLAGGRRFLLAHRMFRSHRTGEVVDPRYRRFSFPPRWHYDVLRGLDHLRDADQLPDVTSPPDPAAAEAVELVRAKRRPDGRWPLQSRYPGRAWFEMERVGGPSRWNTLRALRVLRWWDRAEQTDRAE